MQKKQKLEMTKECKKNLSETNKGTYYNQKALSEYEYKNRFFHGSEYSSDEWEDPNNFECKDENQ